MATIKPRQPKHTKQIYGAFPKSRAVRCWEQQTGGLVQQEPHPVPAPAGYPQSGPPDEQLASGGVRRFQALDGVRDPFGAPWKAQPVPRNRLVVWHWWLPNPEEVTQLRYWVTVDGWNPDELLQRDMFEPQPFLVVPWGRAGTTVQALSHWGRTPNKAGRHVIYAVWDAAASPVSYYQTIDVDLRDAS